MAHFYATVQGKSTTIASRCGTKKSGIYCHLRDWSRGVMVHGYEYCGKNYFKIFMTNGSSANEKTVLLLTIRENGEVDFEHHHNADEPF